VSVPAMEPEPKKPEPKWITPPEESTALPRTVPVPASTPVELTVTVLDMSVLPRRLRTPLLITVLPV